MTMSIDLLKFLKKIRKTPGMYLGGVSLVALNHFMGGYSVKEYEIDGWSHTTLLCLKDFHAFIEDVYSIKAAAKSVFTIIAENTTNDEEAFHKFFELLEEYLERAHPDLAREFKASL